MSKQCTLSITNDVWQLIGFIKRSSQRRISPFFSCSHEMIWERTGRSTLHARVCHFKQNKGKLQVETPKFTRLSSPDWIAAWVARDCDVCLQKDVKQCCDTINFTMSQSLILFSLSQCVLFTHQFNELGYLTSLKSCFINMCWFQNLKTSGPKTRY